MDNKLKIAICLFGSTGYKESITRTEQDFNELETYDINEPIDSLMKHVITPNNMDVFVHSWSLNNQEILLSKLSPVDYIFEDYKPFAKDFDSRKNHLYSRFYSAKKSNDLKKQFEIVNKFNYDIVIHSRLDLIWFNDISFKFDVKDKMYCSHWNSSKRPNLLGPYDRSNFGQGIALMDAWFYSNSENMDNFSVLFDKLNILGFRTYKNHKSFIKRLKDFDFGNRFYLNSHHYAYAHAKRCKLEIDYDYFRGFDWEVYRNYIQENWTNILED